MLRMTLTARRKTRGAGSALAMALALAGGSVAATAMLSAPAYAQNSEGFAEVYQPIANLVNSNADNAGAKARIPAMVAAIQTADDRNLAGNLIITLGNNLRDPVLQRQGLELVLASGKTAPAELGQLQFEIGRLAYQAKDHAAARTAMLAAIAAGYTASDIDGIIAETYFAEGQNAQGLDYLRGAIEKRAAARQTIPDGWLVRGLAVAYTAQLQAQAADWSALLLQHGTSDKKWLQALQVMNAVSAGDQQAQLDLLRLMALTNTLTDRTEYVAYIEAADPRIMSNEVDRVLKAAVAAGALSTSEEYYAEVKRIVDERAAVDRSEAPKMAADARASAQARDAQNAGDVFLSLGSYAEAEEMFKLALEKPGVNRDVALTRLGIAQVHQGKYAEARATFEQVSGNRTAVARMWTAYASSRA